MKAHLIVILALLASPAAFAEKTLQECIDTESDLERLICYDTIFNHTKNKDSYSNLNSASTTRVSDNSTTNNFGKELVKKDPNFHVDAISSVAKGTFSIWRKGTVLKLSNGQEWKVSSSKRLVHKITDPKVTIEKAALGTYKLGIEGVNTRLNVKRIK